MERKEEICESCGDEMKLYERPFERILVRIPFTSVEIISRSWSHREYVCLDCERDRQDEPYHKAYDAGVESGARQAIESLNNP